MKLSCYLVFCFCLVASTASPLRAADKLSPQAVLAVAKMAGACGILDSLIQQQKSTKLPGGNEFVARFWSAEATQLGYSVQQLSDICSKSVAAYDRLWAAVEHAQTK